MKERNYFLAVATIWLLVIGVVVVGAQEKAVEPEDPAKVAAEPKDLVETEPPPILRNDVVLTITYRNAQLDKVYPLYFVAKREFPGAIVEMRIGK
jgi:hypothetical protein